MATTFVSLSSHFSIFSELSRQLFILSLVSVLVTVASENEVVKQCKMAGNLEREWTGVDARTRIAVDMSGKQPLAIAGTEGVSSLLVDALPYIDTDYGEKERQHALELIANECKVFLPTKNYLRHLSIPDYDAFLTPTLLKEHERMTKKEEMTKLDMSRCEVPAPSAARSTDKQAWKKAIDNAKAQNEHLRVREENLELLEELAAEAMLRRNAEIEKLLSSEENALRLCKQETLRVHAKRKSSQLETAAKLKQGEAAWVAMLTNNYQMEMAINSLSQHNEERAKRLHLDPATLQNN